MTTLLIRTAAALVLLLVALAGWVRLAPAEPRRWHVDPAAVTDRGARNSYLLAAAPGADGPAAVVALAPAEAAARLAAIVLATPRTRTLAGDAAFGTYVTRSALWGFPDYTSIRIVPAGDGAEVRVFARARFGTEDFGVNRARVQGWMAALAAQAGAQGS